jgi:hypothetical protein
MTESELNQAIQKGDVAPADANPDTSTENPQTPSAPAQEPTNVEQYIPIMVDLSNVRRYLSSAPTMAPQSFQDQIQFVYDGTSYFLYFWANNQWNGIPVPTSSGAFISSGSITDVTTDANFGVTPQNNDTVVTHGLGTTPKMILLTLGQLRVPANNGGSQAHSYYQLFLFFGGSGNLIGGLTEWSNSLDPTPYLQAGGLTTSFSRGGTTNGSHVTVSLVSIGATTFTFRITYYADNTNNISAVMATGITYICIA